MENLFPDQLTHVRLTAALLALCLLGAPLRAADELVSVNPDAPITIDADSSEFDYESSRLVFHGLRMDQGTLGIEADMAETDKLDFTNGVWIFSGNVRFEADNARLYCDRARLRFIDHQLAAAELRGAPARFEQTIAETGKVNRGKAGRIVYEFKANTLELSDEAQFSDGANEISGDLITYDILAQRLTAGSGESGPVKILIEPPIREADSE